MANVPQSEANPCNGVSSVGIVSVSLGSFPVVFPGFIRMMVFLVGLGGRLQDCLLRGEEFVDAFFGVVEHLAQLGSGVGVVFGGGLSFD
jgi:hypothetical protein